MESQAIGPSLAVSLRAGVSIHLVTLDDLLVVRPDENVSGFQAIKAGSRRWEDCDRWRAHADLATAFPIAINVLAHAPRRVLNHRRSFFHCDRVRGLVRSCKPGKVGAHVALISRQRGERSDTVRDLFGLN